MKKVFGILFILFTTDAFATFSCEVDVSRVLVYGNGTVNVLHTGRGEYTYICDLNGDWKGVDTVTCAMWTSLIQNSQNNDKKVIFYYDEAGSCSSLPTYGNAPAPTYIGVID